MGEVKIKTNRRWREFVPREEVPADVLKSEFDWTNPEDHGDGFFKYRRTWYHLSEFERLSSTSSCNVHSAFYGWMGAKCDSFFSGTVIKLSSDGERFQVGTYTS